MFLLLPTSFTFVLYQDISLVQMYLELFHSQVMCILKTLELKRFLRRKHSVNLILESSKSYESFITVAEENFLTKKLVFTALSRSCSMMVRHQQRLESFDSLAKLHF